jgi:phosphoglucosamine mutase
MPKQMFGTDGVRGIPGEYPLDDQTLYWIGRSVGAYLRRREKAPRVLIGMDTRESGPHIAALIAAGLAAEGGLALPAWPAWCARRHFPPVW